MTQAKIDGFGLRQSELLQLLMRNKDGLTVEQLAVQLDISRTAVNQHLAALERDGHVERMDLTPTGGRPGRVFALTRRGINLFPKQYNLFSTLLLESMLKTLGREDVLTYLDGLGKDMAADLSRDLHGKPLDEKLGAITAFMNEVGFDARVADSSSVGAPTIEANNCIYHDLAQTHPEVCRLDLSLLETASGKAVEHTCCMARGAGLCRFTFSAN